MKRIFHFLWHERAHLLIGLAVVFFVQWLEYDGWLAGIEGRMLDLYLKGPMRSTPARKTPPIAIVEIDDDAYQNCMGGSSPMEPKNIRSLIDALLAGENSRRPLVFAIDILTDSPKFSYNEFRDLATQYPQTTFVWTVPPKTQTEYVPNFFEWLTGEEHEISVQPGTVLGRTLGSEDKDSNKDVDKEADKVDGQYWAIPVFPKDEDLRLRRFPREVRVALGKTAPVVETLATRIGALRTGVTDEDAQEVIVSYRTPLNNRFAVTEMFDCASTPPSVKNSATTKQFLELIKNEPAPIVLLGGSWSTSGDFYTTSDGVKSGLLINAYALQAELAGKRIHEAWHPVLIFLDILVSISVLLVSHSVKRIRSIVQRMRAMIRRTVYVIIAILLISRGAFWLGFIWLSWIGVAVGTTIELLIHIYSQESGHRKKAKAVG